MVTSSPGADYKRRRNRVVSCPDAGRRGGAGVLIGVGLDLVDPARVDRALRRFGERFVRKLMDPEEAGRLPADEGARAAALAVAVALKEAASKAIGTGWSQGVRWRDVVVAAAPLEPSGPAPARVRLDGRAAEVAGSLGSGGRTRARVERRAGLVIGEVWLLS
jgi:holo-[acyl-carrier protein] synthase